jgi:tRNA-dihydrouridine synthase A
VHPSPAPSPWRFCVAPMLDWTDRHCRFFLRQLSQHARLYTEMVTTGALLNADPARWLDYDAAEHPVALQLGGSDPDALARCARLAERWGYDEVNLNVGCPSDRVQGGQFGACLMATPTLVASAVAAMRDACGLPVTVKCRIGIDDQDDDTDLFRFVSQVSGAGCQTFIVHARKAWLKGLSPKENREIPPLNYPRVQRLKSEFPNLEVVINGGITTMEACLDHLQHLEGVMVGREAYQNPWMLSGVDGRLFGQPETAPTGRAAIVHAMHAYALQHWQGGTAVQHISRHLLGLFHGIPGGRRWRRHLSENARGAHPDILLDALSLVSLTDTGSVA